MCGVISDLILSVKQTRSVSALFTGTRVEYGWMQQIHCTRLNVAWRAVTLEKNTNNVNKKERPGTSRICCDSINRCRSHQGRKIMATHGNGHPFFFWHRYVDDVISCIPKHWRVKPCTIILKLTSSCSSLWMFRKITASGSWLENHEKWYWTCFFMFLFAMLTLINTWTAAATTLLTWRNGSLFCLVYAQTGFAMMSSGGENLTRSMKHLQLMVIRRK